MKELIARFNALPRAAQWLAFLGLFVLGYLGVVMPAMAFMDRISSREVALERQLSSQKDLMEPEGSGAQMISGMQASFGAPLMPSPGGLKPEAFTRAVNTILENHGISNGGNISERRIRMTGDLAPALNVGSIDRLILEVSFEARPDVVAAILADLERSPEVAAVSRVRLDKTGVRGTLSGAGEDDELVRATILPEAWIVGGSGGGGVTQ